MKHRVTLSLIACALALSVGCGSDDGDSDGGGGSANQSGTGGTANGGGGSANGGTVNGGTGGIATGGTGGNGGNGSMTTRAQKVKKPLASTSKTAPVGAPSMTNATGAGSGALVNNTAQPGDTGDQEWITVEDLDGDGVDEDVYVLIDDETGDKYVWYTTVIDEFCDNGDDANATVLMYYEAESDSWTLLWDSDCDEDENLIYGCSLDDAGDADECDVCEVDEAGDLTCLSDVEGGPDAGAPDSGAPTADPAWDCTCEANCDEEIFDVSSETPFCVETDQAAEDAAYDECIGSFGAEECASLSCDCQCAPAEDFVCE